MESTIASKIPFKDLCHLCEKISVSVRNKKSELFRKYYNYFRDYAKKIKQESPSLDDSFYPILRLLLPQLDRERGAYGVKEHNLAKIYIRVLGLPKDGHDATKLLNFRAPKTAGNLAGDFAEVAFWILKSRCPEGGSLTVKQVNMHLDNVAMKHAAHDPRGVDAELVAMLTSMSAAEQKWLIRMLIKDMKLGFSQGRIFGIFHPDARELYDVSNNLHKVCHLLRDPTTRLHEVEVSVFSPFRPMLAERCNVRTAEESMKKSHFYYIETKHDGERFQLHMENGIFKYFSRNGLEYTDVYASILTPHIKKLLRPDVKSCILDGEMMGWNPNLKCYKTKGNNFDVKFLKEGDSIRPCLCVFDILFCNGQVLTNKPLSERMKHLENLFTQSEGIMMYTERKEVTTGQEVIDELNLAIDNRLEGIVLKDPTSIYKPNTRKGGWYKIKPEYTEGLMDHLDLIIMGGYFGEGRRKGTISHFLIGAAVPPSTEGADPVEFHSLTRVGSGYSMDELSELLLKLSPHWQRVKPGGQCPPSLVWTKEKPDVWIAPHNSYILEIKATEIVPSNAFKVDHTLRFPRVEIIRYDKKWSDCMTITEFENLRKEASGKLYSRHVDADDELPVPTKKKKRQLAQVPVALGSQFRGADVSAVDVTSNSLRQKEFCVLTDWKEHTKQNIEIKIAQNGGTIVQSTGCNTFCALAGEMTLRVRTVAKFGQCNVVHISWLLRCLNAGLLLPWSPADLLYATETVKQELSTKYDKFGDSYTEPLTEDTVKFVLEEVERTGSSVNLTEEMVADFEIELFSGPSPFAMFRLCRVYFDKYMKLNDPSSEASTCLDIEELDFSFCGGQTSTQIDELTTHVVMHSSCQDRLNKIKDVNRNRIRKFRIVSEQWVQETVKCKKRQDERDYSL
ncbi:DNA ligase 4-like isoform X2 [Periplaneta americana]|uniref:DNA ligase 4-like isoform X2 n=2 Tax=Periplaneta americana TaxID=6978 RepID=UPI0037E7D48F